MTTPDANSSVTVNVNTLNLISASAAGNKQHHGSGGATRPVPASTSVATKWNSPPVSFNI